MKSFLLSFLKICFLVIVISCNKKQASIPAATTSQQQQPQYEFIPSADSTIAAQQISCWLKCNKRLDSLSIAFQELLRTSDSSLRHKLQQDFIDAQNQICLAEGLRGGYKEYLWITEHAGNPKNKALLDSFKITSF